jgi:hypothetical protein
MFTVNCLQTEADARASRVLRRPDWSPASWGFDVSGRVGCPVAAIQLVKNA